MSPDWGAEMARFGESGQTVPITMNQIAREVPAANCCGLCRRFS
jgi:hypothetical protein